MSIWLIERAGVELTINLKSSAAETLLESVMSAMGAEQVRRKRGFRLVVGGDSGAWELNDRHAKIERKLKLDGDLIYHLTDRIVFHIADNAEGVHCIHAAAVAHGDGVLVVPARSGAGKSTFTAWLVHMGFDYLTDELILINSSVK